MKNLLTSCLLLCLSLVCWQAYADLEKDNERLKQVQKQIQQKRKQLEQQQKQQSSLQASFEAAELKVAEVALTITQTNNGLELVNGKISKLQQEQRKLNKQKQQQQKVLAEMIRTAYLNGKHDYTKLLLNQDDPAQLERLITYYRKLNSARVEQLEEIKKVLDRLAQIKQELSTQQSQLATLKQQQQEEKKLLVSSQLERKKALRQLNAQIKTDKQKLERLRQDQQSLELAIENAKRNAKVSPESLAGLYKLKKKLKWPTRGRLSRKFGQRRTGSLRWKGVVIDGGLGNRVNAIADGIVLYADWLKGFGWVTVVDHGKGYMSLYGHNQALLKQAGDYVQQGEPVALVGQSGGQSYPNLYFEIRYKGETVNPARWCR